MNAVLDKPRAKAPAAKPKPDPTADVDERAVQAPATAQKAAPISVDFGCDNAGHSIESAKKPRTRNPMNHSSGWTREMGSKASAILTSTFLCAHPGHKKKSPSSSTSGIAAPKMTSRPQLRHFHMMALLFRAKKSYPGERS